MEKLLKQLEELKKRAAAKLAEMKDDLAVDAARAIETDHAKIMQDIADLEAKIAAKRQAAEDDTVDQPPPAADVATRAADIVGIAATARAQGVEFSTADEQTAIRSGMSAEQFRAQMFDRLAQRSRQNQTEPARINQDERDVQRAAMTEALSYAFGAPIPQAGPSAAARSFMGERDGQGASILALAARSIDYRGRGLMLNAREVDDIYTRAFSPHSTSDFPTIFGSSINRTLEQRYALAQPTFRRIARKKNFRDFRPDTTVKLGDFPMLEKVLETGEIKYGSFVEGAENVQAFSYAKAIAVTRQMLINDDIGAIADLLSSYGATVALFEEVLFYSQAFNGKLADGQTVFHASHNNIGSGTAIDVANVGLGRAGMSKQKSLGGNPLLQNRAKILLTGPDKLTEAELLLTSITPATVATVNPFSGKLEPLETAQISGNAWYLFADPSTGSNYRWGYLDGYEAPRVRTEEPFGVQGIAMSVEHDFGVGATDYRFGWKNPGN